jgi:type I site-specific restriction endonuclease
MIHVERKTIVINGNGAVICCEIESILREFRKSAEEKHGKEAAKELIDKIVENSKKTDEQNEKEIEELKKQASDIFQNILKSVMEGLGE